MHYIQSGHTGCSGFEIFNNRIETHNIPQNYKDLDGTRIGRM